MNTININGTIDEYTRYCVDSGLTINQGQPVRLVINSLGGQVNEAIAISQLIQNHGNVTAEIIGFVASAATIVALGAKKIEMHDSSMWLAHKCMISTCIYGDLNADDIADTIKQLEAQKKIQEAIDLNIAGIYLSKASEKGKNMDDIIKMMEEATWLSAQECKEWGFITDILSDGKKPAVNDALKSIMNKYGMPIPQIDDKSIPPTEPETTEEKPSWFSKLLDSIQALVNQPKDDLKEEVNRLKDEIKQKDERLMTMDALDAKLNLAKENLGSISDEIKAEEDIIKQIEMAKAIIDSIPATIVKPNGEADEQKKYSDIAVDPINNYQQE